jgi:cysteine desulfurase
MRPLAERVYLDFNATAPMHPAAQEAWLAVQAEAWANPASIHAEGQRARHLLDRAAGGIAAALGGRSHEWVWCASGTEANNLAIHSVLSQNPGRVVVSAIEHSSVLRAAERHVGCTELVTVGVDSHGRVDPQELVAAWTPDTRLVAVQFANNELGTVQPITDIAAALSELEATPFFLCDGAQGAGKTTIDVATLGVDFFSLAAHKFGGPKGGGLLWLRGGSRPQALVHGGRQQQDRRSGTEDPATATATVAALEAHLRELASESDRQAALLTALFARLHAAHPALRWLGADAERLPGVCNLAHPGLLADDLVLRLDLAGFAVSKGSACMARHDEPSHVIAALGLAPELARSAIRISIGPSTTAEELERFAAVYAAELASVAS